MSPDNQTARPQPRLSIIMLSYNTKQITIDCLESIFKSNPKVPFEIILIDNASQDDSPQALREYATHHPEIVFIENKENTGFVKANNQGVKLAKGDYILLLNSDIIVLDTAVDALFTYFTAHEDTIQFLGGKLYNKDMTDQTSCGPFYDLPMMIGWQFLRGDHWGLTRWSPNTVKEVDWITGACILTKKEYFNQVGGFDETIFMYMDEIDLLMRAKKMGYRVFFTPEARFVHLGSASSGGRTYPVLQVYRGIFFLYKKHYPSWQLNMLKYMLQMKALAALAIGKITHNEYLIKTYGEAYKIAQMA